MKSRLSELSTTNPETAEMLCATGLDEVLKAIQNPQTTADDIITAWLHVKEYTDIQVDVDNEQMQYHSRSKCYLSYTTCTICVQSCVIAVL